MKLASLVETLDSTVPGVLERLGVPAPLPDEMGSGYVPGGAILTGANV